MVNVLMDKEKVRDLGNAPLPVAPYLEKEVFDLEKAKVFKKSWLCVAHETDVAAPGDYITRDISVLDTSIIIVRANDGGLNAFHNVCKHRGHRVALEERGNARGFKCIFHAWTYGIDGALKGVPDEKNFGTLDKAKLGLSPVSVDSWKGFIFINVDPSPRQTLRESMGELASQFDNFPCEKWPAAATMSAKLNCNWKLVVEAFMEAYHVVSLHGQSAPRVFSSLENPFGHLNGIRLFEKHRAISVYGNPQQTPTEAVKLNIKFASSAVYVTADESQQADGELAEGVNPDRRGDWAFDEYLVHPNFSFYTAYGWVLAARYWPVAEDRCEYEISLHVPKPASASERIAMEQTLVHLFDVVLEDLSTVERTQEVLKSGAIEEFQLGNMELALRHGAKVIQEEINA